MSIKFKNLKSNSDLNNNKHDVYLNSLILILQDVAQS